MSNRKTNLALALTVARAAAAAAALFVTAAALRLGGSRGAVLLVQGEQADFPGGRSGGFRELPLLLQSRGGLGQPLYLRVYVECGFGLVCVGW